MTTPFGDYLAPVSHWLNGVVFQVSKWAAQSQLPPDAAMLALGIPYPHPESPLELSEDIRRIKELDEDFLSRITFDPPSSAIHIRRRLAHRRSMLDYVETILPDFLELHGETAFRELAAKIMKVPETLHAAKAVMGQPPIWHGTMYSVDFRVSHAQSEYASCHYYLWHQLIDLGYGPALSDHVKADPAMADQRRGVPDDQRSMATKKGG